MQTENTFKELIDVPVTTYNLLLPGHRDIGVALTNLFMTFVVGRRFF